MRLIGALNSEHAAFNVLCALEREGIIGHVEGVEIWIENEDEVELAKEIFNAYKKAPLSKRFIKAPPDVESAQEPSVKVRLQRPVFLTKAVIGLCVFFYFLSWYQAVNTMPKGARKGNLMKLTPIASIMLYDFPKTFELMRSFAAKYGAAPENIPESGKAFFRQIEQTPYWQGVYNWLVLYPQVDPSISAPLFEKIREGQVWRLITPVFLHGNIIHILFNMLWLWLLGKMIEERIRPIKYLFMMLIVGIVSNTAQYLVSGPFFIGYSGIITGLAGYIWVRQKVAPWEGYPLPQATLVFFMVFIFGMAALGVVGFVLERIGIYWLSFGLANTAHIVGLLSGGLCGYIPFFTKRRRA